MIGYYYSQVLGPPKNKQLRGTSEISPSSARAHWSVGFAGSYLKSPQIVTTTREEDEVDEDGDGDGMGEKGEDPRKSAQTLNTVTSASL